MENNTEEKFRLHEITLFFVCNYENRSRAGKRVVEELGYCGMAAGIDCPFRPLNIERLGVADKIFVFEEAHVAFIKNKWPEIAEMVPIINLDIPDDYDYGDEVLLRLIKEKVMRWLPNPLSKKLAEMHSEIYLSSSCKKIISDLEGTKHCNYLAEFYKDYLSKMKFAEQRKLEDKDARSVDLPFIGENVLEKRGSTIMFVSIGSLSNIEKLSVTLLACFWLDDNNSHGELIEEYWKSKPYYRMKEKLRIDSSIAANSYVVDAKRTSDTKKNRRLLFQEIDLLKPELIVLIGREPERILGWKNKSSPLYNMDEYIIRVPFPRNWVSNENEKEEEKIYSILQEKMDAILKR